MAHGNQSSGSRRDESLGPQRRIKRRQDFLRIQQGGRKARSRHLLLAMALPREAEQAESRLGITVTRKIDKRAARRNTFKRRIREHYRRLRSRLQQPTDIVVIALAGATELGFEELGRELKGVLRKAKLL
ncbi:MAG: ribonuclease P protein component [Bdellovibrionales bacterium]|nr:ribonuclease P protein component [Bdellovibrionales bacterium]